MPKPKPDAVSPENGKEFVRITLRFHGPELGQIRRVRDLLKLNSEVDAARYLMQRGLEAMAGTLAATEGSADVTHRVDARDLIKHMVSMGHG